MSNVKILCRYCGTAMSIPKSKLIQRFGRVVKLKCKDDTCKGITAFEVNQEFADSVNLFDKKKASPASDPKTEVWNKKESQAQKAYFEYLDEGGVTKRVLLNPGDTVVGRKSSSSTADMIALETNDRKVSRKHFKITLLSTEKGLRLKIMDLDSLNGTYINDKNYKLSGRDVVALQNGDQILVGDLRLKVILI